MHTYIYAFVIGKSGTPFLFSVSFGNNVGLQTTSIFAYLWKILKNAVILRTLKHFFATRTIKNGEMS